MLEYTLNRLEIIEFQGGFTNIHLKSRESHGIYLKILYILILPVANTGNNTFPP